MRQAMNEGKERPEMPKPAVERTVPLVQAAVRLRESYVVTWGRVLRGELAGEKKGSRWMVDARDLERFAQNRETQPAA
jgi:hypothetical protein